MLQQHFKIKDLRGDEILDLEIARSKHGIVVCQQKFALDLTAELGLACPKPASTPLEVNQRFTSVEFEQSNKKKA